jgi:microcystin-dependent protein
MFHKILRYIQYLATHMVDKITLPDLRGKVPMSVVSDEVGKTTSATSTTLNVTGTTPVIVQKVPPPAIGLYYIICLQGAYPSRN